MIIALLTRRVHPLPIVTMMAPASLERTVKTVQTTVQVKPMENLRVDIVVAMAVNRLLKLQQFAMVIFKNQAAVQHRSNSLRRVVMARACSRVGVSLMVCLHLVQGNNRSARMSLSWEL